jgi:hypothetical protein
MLMFAMGGWSFAASTQSTIRCSRPADVTALVFVGEDADHTAVVSDMSMDII